MDGREREKERESLIHLVNTSPPSRCGGRESGRDSVGEDEWSQVGSKLSSSSSSSSSFFLSFFPHLAPRWAGPFELHSSIMFQRRQKKR